MASSNQFLQDLDALAKAEVRPPGGLILCLAKARGRLQRPWGHGAMVIWLSSRYMAN